LSEIRGCKISDSGKSGIYLQATSKNLKSRAGDYLPNLITNCIIYGGNYGIELQKTICTNIVACQVFMTKSAGFYINGANSTLISGCRTYQISDDAIRAVKSHELNVSSNIFCWHEGHGILLDNVIWGTINGWGGEWFFYDASTRADFYTRVFSGLIKLGQDDSKTFDCVPVGESLCCNSKQQNCKLENFKRSLLERLRYERLAGRPFNGLFLPVEYF
jgi:hypothetical protein